MEKIAEYTLAAVKNRKLWYLNFLINITYLCDCKGKKQKPFMKDIGILLSKDPVAIDKASLDLVIKHNKGEDPLVNHFQHIILTPQSEELGLGSKDYVLEVVN